MKEICGSIFTKLDQIGNKLIYPQSENAANTKTYLSLARKRNHMKDISIFCLFPKTNSWEEIPQIAI